MIWFKACSLHVHVERWENWTIRLRVLKNGSGCILMCNKCTSLNQCGLIHLSNYCLYSLRWASDGNLKYSRKVSKKTWPGLFLSLSASVFLHLRFNMVTWFIGCIWISGKVKQYAALKEFEAGCRLCITIPIPFIKLLIHGRQVWFKKKTKKTFYYFII